MLESAQALKDLLLRHGLAEPLLDSLAQDLAALDQAVEEAEAGRRQQSGDAGGQSQ